MTIHKYVKTLAAEFGFDQLNEFLVRLAASLVKQNHLKLLFNSHTFVPI